MHVECPVRENVHLYGQVEGGRLGLVGVQPLEGRGVEQAPLLDAPPPGHRQRIAPCTHTTQTSEQAYSTQ